jgi:hypothetical protein
MTKAGSTYHFPQAKTKAGSTYHFPHVGHAGEGKQSSEVLPHPCEGAISGANLPPLAKSLPDLILGSMGEPVALGLAFLLPSLAPLPPLLEKDAKKGDKKIQFAPNPDG